MVAEVCQRERLTPKQEAFCLEYIKLDANGTKAALAAGYDCKDETVANAIAVENLQKPLIKARIEALRAAIADETIMAVKERQARLSEIARARLVDFVADGEPTFSENTPHHEAASEYSVTTKYNKNGEPYVTKSIKLRDPVQAISELNKMDHVYETGTKVIVLVASPDQLIEANRRMLEIASQETKLLEEFTDSEAKTE